MLEKEEKVSATSSVGLMCAGETITEEASERDQTL